MIIREVMYGEKFTDLIKELNSTKKIHLSIPKPLFINLKEDKIDLLTFAEDKIIKNIYCGHIIERCGGLLRYKINLGDTVIYNYENNLNHGIVKAITWRGVNISTDYGDRFFKWCHILQINKND